MKRLFLLITFGLLVNSVVGQEPTDLEILEEIKIKTDSLDVRTSRIKIVVDTIVNKVVSSTNCQKCVGKDKLNGREWILIFLPAIIFLILFIIILAGGLNKFDLSGALAENDYTKITQSNPQYIAANINALNAANPQPIPPPDIASIYPPTIEVSNTLVASTFRPSISRYIAFITSILTLIVALCMSCFFIYHYIRTGCAPDLSALSTVLIALGIGVAPYAFNKISTAINKNKPE